jgi:hypothetical protein
MKSGHKKILLESQAPRFMIIKVRVEENGFARVFQNSHTASVEDLKAMIVLEKPFKDWEQVALRRIEAEE